MRLTKIYGFIAIHAALVILFALFFLTRPTADGTAGLLLAGALLLLLINGLVSGLILKSLALPLNNLLKHLDNEAHSLDDAAGRLNGTALALAENSARNSALLEEAAARLSQVSAIIMHDLNDVSEARDILAEISKLVSQSGEILGEIDKNTCLNTSSASDISAEALQLSGKADELIAAARELSAVIHGSEAPDYREASLKSKLARQMLVKALPLADAS